MVSKIDKDEKIDCDDEISETDSSVVSNANDEMSTFCNPKMIDKNKKIDLSVIDSNDFFDIPIKTKIKYVTKEMKINKFNNLFSREKIDSNSSGETKEM